MNEFETEIREAGYEPYELLAEFYGLDTPYKDRFFCDFVDFFTTDEVVDYLEHLFEEYDYTPNDFKRF